MKLSKNCINLVKDFEGYHKKLKDGGCTTYYCPAGVLTIGYGCTEGIKEGEVWTHDQAIFRLKRELTKFEDAVNQLVTVELNQNQFDALVSFAYNVGSGLKPDGTPITEKKGLVHSGLLKKVNQGDFDGAAREFGKWTKGGGKVLPGLVRRRAQEAELFLTPFGSAEPAMAQAVDAPASTASNLGGSRSIWAGLMGLLSLLVGDVTDAARAGWDWLIWLLGIAPAVYSEARQTLTPMQEMAGWFSINIQKVTIVIAVVCIVVFLVRHAQLRMEAKG
jgi:GH24 family phage-related lysozyme (muramidase)